MMTDKLIDEVVKEVLIRMGKITPLKLLKNIEYEEEQLFKLQDRYGFRYLSQEQLWKSNHPFLLPRLTNKQLLSIYNGMSIDLVTSCAMQGFLQGSEILVFESGVELIQNPLPDTPYTNRFKEAYELLMASGLKVIKEEAREVLPIAQDTSHVNRTATVTVHSKILDRKAIAELIQNDTKNIYIPKGAIITPLANDLIREAKVTVERLAV